MINDVQASLYSTVSGISGLTVYQHVPQDDKQYPYVVVDPMSLDFNDWDSETGFAGTFYVHVWSIQKSSSETATIQKQIYDTLHRTAPVITGWCVSFIQQEFTEILLDSDGITRHGVQRYRIAFEPDPSP